MPAWFGILWQNRKCRVGLVMLAGFALVAIFAPWIAPYDPKSTAFERNLDPSRDHLLGTTTAGQDIFSQLIWGARTSLIVGVLGGILATVIALVIGMTAGYLQGIVDEVLSFFINLALVVPVLPLIAVVAAYSPVRGVGIVIIIIGITGWAWGARIKRAQIVSLRDPRLHHRRRLRRREHAADHLPRDHAQHDLAGRDRLHRRRHRRDRGRSRPRLPRSRRPDDDQLGHDALLGQQRRRPRSPASGPGCWRPVSAWRS